MSVDSKGLNQIQSTQRNCEISVAPVVTSGRNKNVIIIAPDGAPMRRIDYLRMLAKKHGILKTEIVTENSGGLGMKETKTPTTPKSVNAEIVETPQESSGALQKILSREGSTSMTQLSKCENKLLDLMDECVSASDLDRAKDGSKRVESHRIDQAIQLANALSNVMQTKVNMLKAMKDYIQ